MAALAAPESYPLNFGALTLCKGEGEGRLPRMRYLSFLGTSGLSEQGKRHIKHPLDSAPVKLS